MAKYVQFALILVACIVLDQGTKYVASTNLASAHGDFEHVIELQIEADDEGKTVAAVLAEEFPSNDAEEIEQMARGYVRDASGARVSGETEVQAGDELVVRYRRVTVIPDYFEFEYTRNPGAAFGLLSEGDSPWRIPFFIVVSILALGVITAMLRGVERHQQLTIWALSLIAGGALGNFIDRVLYGYVIDFIVWKYTDSYRWPTFNIADAFISVGVSLLVLDMILDAVRKRRDGAQ